MDHSGQTFQILADGVSLPSCSFEGRASTLLVQLGEQPTLVWCHHAFLWQNIKPTFPRGSRGSETGSWLVQGCVSVVASNASWSWTLYASSASLELLQIVILNKKSYGSARQRKNMFCFALSLAQGLLLPETYLSADFEKQLFSVLVLPPVMPVLDTWAQLNFSSAL